MGLLDAVLVVLESRRSLIHPARNGMEERLSGSRKSSSEAGATAIRGRPRDPALPRTWERDLVYARELLGRSEPRGVLWVCELRGGDRDRACYRLLVISDFRLHVTNAKQGLVSGFAENVLPGVSPCSHPEHRVTEVYASRRLIFLI